MCRGGVVAELYRRVVENSMFWIDFGVLSLIERLSNLLSESEAYHLSEYIQYCLQFR